MKPENIAQLLTINKGRKAAKKGRELLSCAETPEEKAAARAYKRVTVGTLVLVLVLMVGLMILIPICVISLQLDDGPSRIGTVQYDGQIRYTDNVHVFLSQEELGVQEYQLQPGDKVMIYFDSVTDERTSAYPYAIFEQHTNSRIGIMIGYMVLMVVVLLVYVIVICRFTPFGSAWYQYRRKLQEKEDNDIPLRVKIVIYAISAVIAIAVCWPQIENIIYQQQKMQKVRAMAEVIQSAQEAADRGSDISDTLETVGMSGEVNNAVDSAAQAAGSIGQILDEISGE